MNSTIAINLSFLQTIYLVALGISVWKMWDWLISLFWEWWDDRKQNAKARRFASTPSNPGGWVPKPPKPPPEDLPKNPPSMGQKIRKSLDDTRVRFKSEYQGKHATDPNMKQVQEHDAIPPLSPPLPPDPETVAMRSPHFRPMSDNGSQPDVEDHPTSILQEVSTPPVTESEVRPEPTPIIMETNDTIMDAVVIEDLETEEGLLESRAKPQDYKYYMNGSTIHRRDCPRVKKRVQDHQLDPFLWADDEKEASMYAKERDLHLCGICRPGSPHD